MSDPTEDLWIETPFSETARLRLRCTRQLEHRQTPWQTIDVYDTPDFGRVLMLDSIINVTEKDEHIYHEMLTHVPLCTHPAPRSVVVVGGGDGGIVREAVRHSDIESITLVEIDPEVIEVSRRYFPAVSCGLSDPRAAIVTTDASAYIRDTARECSVIIVDSTDPIGPGQRLFTKSFYADCFRALTHDGILTAQSESPFFDPHIVRDLFSTARSVFPIVRLYIAFMPSYVSGLWSFLYCAKSYDPVRDFDAGRCARYTAHSTYYSAAIHRACFCLPAHLQAEFLPQ